jgi:Fe-S-cluster-containing dehydrogenase component
VKKYEWELLMGLNRRGFLGLATAGSAALVTGAPTVRSETEEVTECEEAYGVLVDTVACIGCRKCEAACNAENKLTDRDPASFDDKSVLEKHRRPDKDAFTVVNRFTDPAHPDKINTMKIQCMHCNHPACVSACIVGAMKKTTHGPVVYDAWKCIGCRYCMIACPFQVPAYQYENALDPQVRKCTFCYERVVEEGRVPACVEICPNEALRFGRRDELIAAAHAKIRDYPGWYFDHVYGEHEVGGTSWLYLSPVDFKLTELPVLPEEPVSKRTERIQHGIFKSFVPPIALYGLLGLIMYSLRERQGEREVES